MDKFASVVRRDSEILCVINHFKQSVLPKPETTYSTCFQDATLVKL